MISSKNRVHKTQLDYRRLNRYNFMKVGEETK